MSEGNTLSMKQSNGVRFSLIVGTRKKFSSIFVVISECGVRVAWSPWKRAERCSNQVTLTNQIMRFNRSLLPSERSCTGAIPVYLTNVVSAYVMLSEIKVIKSESWITDKYGQEQSWKWHHVTNAREGLHSY